MKTMQEIYDTVKAHLLAQGRKAQVKVDGRYKCQYRASDGAACAIGCLIPPECYDPVIEGWGIATTGIRVEANIRKALECSGIPDDLATRYLLAELQEIHDDTDPPDWHTNLEAFATKHGLRP